MTIRGQSNMAGAYSYTNAKTSNQKQFTLPDAENFGLLTSKDIDRIQKEGGFVNTMAALSSSDKALYDELVAKGETEAAQGLMLVGMTRVASGGQQISLPNGAKFDPVNTEVTAESIKNLFKYAFVSGDGYTDRIFDSLASVLERKQNENNRTF